MTYIELVFELGNLTSILPCQKCYLSHNMRQYSTFGACAAWLNQQEH